MIDKLVHICRGLLSRPSYMLLAASDDELSRQPPQRFVHAWWGLLLLSLAWGVALACLWAGAWAVFAHSSTSLHLIPALSFVLATTLWLYRPATLSLAEALAGRDARSLGVSVVVVSLLLAGIGLPGGGVRSSLHLSVWWQWLQPYPEYRVLILAPVWGAWAMLVTCQFRKPCDQTEPAVVALARGAGPIVATASMGALMAASLCWLNFLPWTRVLIPAVAAVVATVGGPVLCIRAGGLKRSALLAGNLLTQFAFWMAYLACLACR